jgi:hypothetical protein
MEKLSKMKHEKHRSAEIEKQFEDGSRKVYFGCQ